MEKCGQSWAELSRWNGLVEMGEQEAGGLREEQPAWTAQGWEKAMGTWVPVPNLCLLALAGDAPLPLRPAPDA